MDCQGAQSQKEGQEEGTKDLGRGTTLALLPLPGSSGLPFGSGLPGNPPNNPNPSSYPCVEACGPRFFEGFSKVAQLSPPSIKTCSIEVYTALPWISYCL